MTEEMIEFAKLHFDRDLLREDVNKKLDAEPNSLNMMDVIEKAALDINSSDTNDFDFLIYYTCTELYENRRLPEFLSKFAADVLSGKRKRPTKRGADKYVNWERNYKLWSTVKKVSETFSLPCYSTNELSDKTSAAEVVSSATGLKVDTVIKAFQKCKRNLGEK